MVDSRRLWTDFDSGYDSVFDSVFGSGFGSAFDSDIDSDHDTIFDSPSVCSNVVRRSVYAGSVGFVAVHDDLCWLIVF